MFKHKHNFSEHDIEYIIKLRESGLRHKDIANIMNVSKSSITRVLNNNGIQSRHINIEDDLKHKIINMYKNGYSLKYISKNLHIGERRISAIIEDEGIKRTMSELKRKYDIDMDYFKNIDTQEKAYSLCLIYADGNVNIFNNNSYRFSISLQEEDKYILELLSSMFAGSRPLSFIGYNDKNPNRKNQYCLRITNNEFCSHLISQGVVPRKSLILEFPKNIPNDLIRHFVRGYMDGDGTISKKENKCSLVSTESFCKSLQDVLAESVGVKSYIYYAHDKNKSTRTLSISRSDSEKFLHWIYKDSKIHLVRKYDIYKEKYCVA